jgi:ABC-type transporter MlaC component
LRAEQKQTPRVEEPAMNKQQMIEAIRNRNRTAGEDFLTTFDENALRSYLDRLTNIQGRRGKTSIWVRPGDTTSIVTRLH